MKRVILITGGNGGMGVAIGRYFLEAEEDSVVYLSVRTNRGHAEDLSSEFPQNCRLVTLDVTSSSEWKEAVEKILSEEGQLDVLVNNAGGHEDSLLATMSDDAWRSVIASNLDSVFLGCRAVIPPMMKQRNGRIVNIASLSALLAPRGQTNYSAAKAGVVALTQSLAKETARAGITVNSVCPGYVETEALAAMPEAERKATRSSIPMRRFGSPEEIAACVHFLSSKGASYVTGSVLKVDGGIF